MVTHHRRYTISIPDARSLMVARVFTVAVARLHDVDDETVDDLRLAVSEAATLGLTAGGPVDIAIAVGTGRLHVTVGPVRPQASSPPGPDPADVITALFPQATVGTSIEFDVAVGTVPTG